MAEAEAIPLPSQTKVFGFWIYLMTDLVIFAALFATFVTMREMTFGGPTGRQLFEMSDAMQETAALLTSSFTCSIANLFVLRGRKKAALLWFAITFLLGASFVTMEVMEFSKFISEGNSWLRSGFLSSFFALVGTHGFHVSIGLLWMLIIMARIAIRGPGGETVSPTFRMVLFWHFLDIVWIFIFTVVYAMSQLYA
jgi:heme/copper-type cytochrome/quinol oxidase subunit 3